MIPWLAQELIMQIQIPPPKLWQDFEHLCFLLWREMWRDPSTQKNGRQGQPQNGVDVFGRPERGFAHNGVQCKGKGAYHHKQLTEAEIVNESKNATGFTPRLDHFIIAATTPRDSDIQTHVRKLNTARKFPFTVTTWFWDDIAEELHQRPAILKLVYPQLMIPELVVDQSQGLVTAVHHRSEPIDRIHVMLSADAFRSGLTEHLRADVRNVMIELALNAYEHGDASRVELSLADKTIIFRDNGTAFDPTEALSAPEAGAGTGLFLLRLFAQKYKDTITISYTRTNDDKNELHVTFPRLLTQRQANVTCQVLVSELEAFSPAKARFIAETADIPTGCKTYFYHASSRFFSPSSFFYFLEALLPRIPSCSNLKITYDNSDSLEGCIPHWKKWRPDLPWHVLI